MHPKFRLVWEPLPGASELALCCPAQRILFSGTRGCGKTETQLMHFRASVGLGYGSFVRGIFFDVEYKNLDDAISRSHKLFSKFDDGAVFRGAAKDLHWSWPSGEKLFFRVGSTVEDYPAYHGHEYSHLMFNELTKHPTSEFYEMMHACNRTSFVPEKNRLADGTLLPRLFEQSFATTNPSGVGRNWVKNMFIDQAAPGKIIRKPVKIFNPKTEKEEECETTLCWLHGSYIENPYLSPQYIASLQNISDVNLKRAWALGMWDCTFGGALDDLWKSQVHILPRFKLPKTWQVFRSCDWGSARPYAVLYFAVSDGCEFDLPNGKKDRLPKGSVVVCNELYGGRNYFENIGSNESVFTVASKIKSLDAGMLQMGWCGNKVIGGPIDNAVATSTSSDSESPLNLFEKNGVYWAQSDKSPGSRIRGLQLIRDGLSSSIEYRSRGEVSSSAADPIFVMDNCKAFLNTVPPIQRDPRNLEDVDSKSIDHMYDALRYFALSRSRKYSGLKADVSFR